MRASFFFATLFFLCINTVFAQHQLTGTVKDKADGSPFPYVTAALLRPDSSVVTGVITNDSGRFVIEKVNPGDYIVQLSFIGYKKEYLQVNVPAQSDLGEITLAEDANMLAEVVVRGRRALVEQRIDRVVVNVAGNMITSGLNISDLLRQLPGLVVDDDNNVKLNGNNVTVYIDGRPPRLPAEQIAQMLKGMMSDMVDRVELIANPSSRYEAGMSSAIVNIRMKRDATLGLNGSLQGGVGFLEHNVASMGGLNLNYRSKAVNIFGNYGYNKSPNHSDLYQDRNYSGETPITYNQHSLMQNKTNSHSYRAGIDWFVSPKQTLGFLFNGAESDGKGDITARADIGQTGASKIDSTERSVTWSGSKYSSQMFNLHYQFSISEGEELQVDADYGRAYNRSWQRMQSNSLNPDGIQRGSQREFQYSGPRNIDIMSLKIDYEKAFSKNSGMEVGVKTGQTYTDNEFSYENLYDGRWVIDNNQSNRFKYTEQISAAYAMYSQKFGKFGAMAGLRAEYTTIKGESPTMDTTFTHSYLDWFPSAYLQYQINERQGLNLSYTRKIERPGYSSLNPFRTYIDPFTYQSGNPDLTPSYRTNITLRYNLSRYAASIGTFLSENIYEQDYEQDDVTHTTGLVMRNLGQKRGITVSLSAPFRVAKWYNLQIYLEGSRTQVKTHQSGKDFQKIYIAAYGTMQHAFTILPTLRASIYMSAVKLPWNGIMHYEDYWGMSARVEKSFFDQRMSLTLAVEDPFKSNIRKGSINFGNINQSIRQYPDSRVISLVARYSFGSQKIRAARNRNVGIEEEMGRAK